MVVYAGAYPDANSVAFLAQAGVALQKFTVAERGMMNDG